MTYSTSWNTETAKDVFAGLTHIANEMLDTAAQASSPESAGTAGPQEVVDALSAIVDQLEQIQAAIPAEPSNDGEQPGAEPVSAPPVPEEPKIASLNSKIAELELKVESAEKERVAEQFAELYSDPKVQQAKYNEVISSKEKPSYWIAKIDAISGFQKEAGLESYKPAQQTSTWLKPMTRVAKLDNERMRL